MNHKPIASSGFTLIELMIVMAIMALLMALVGPLTIQGYEKMKGKEEQLALKNWLRANSYRSFATGQAGEFTLDKNQAVFGYPLLAANPVLAARGEAEQGLPDDNGEPDQQHIVSKRSFKYLNFQPQTLRVNTFGLVFPAEVRLQLRGEDLSLDLNERVHAIKE
jgi:prepilin-type N-terminal cleavage/methylation domain-containing protein